MQSEEGGEPDNPMSPEQIAILLDRQIALGRELDNTLEDQSALKGASVRD